MFFHICTDGTSNGIVHRDNNDYLAAVRISAINACVHDVGILCYCHMSTHSHFVVECEDSSHAKSFIEAYKRDYGSYLRRAGDIAQVYREIQCRPIEVSDLFYLKNCIAYVLLNPVEAGIVKRPEDYRWSSFDCYFNKSPVTGRALSSIPIRRVQKEILHTHKNVMNMGLLIHEDGSLEERSFVHYHRVERLYYERTEFYRSLALTKSEKEEEKYVAHVMKYNDSELYAEALGYMSRHFSETRINLLRKEQKYAVLTYLRHKCHASNRRLARVLNLNLSEVDRIVGDIVQE